MPPAQLHLAMLLLLLLLLHIQNFSRKQRKQRRNGKCKRDGERAKKMTVATVLRERFDLGPVLWDAKRNEGRGSEREGGGE